MRQEAMRVNRQRKFLFYKVVDSYDGLTISTHFTRSEANAARSECSHRVHGTNDPGELVA